MYEDYLAPEEEIINYNFYEKAIATLCQSTFHKNIVQSNLDLDNVVNLSGNMWSDESLEKISVFSLESKSDSCAIMDSQISHKNTQGAVLYCKKNNLSYELIPNCEYHKFL